MLGKAQRLVSIITTIVLGWSGGWVTVTSYPTRNGSLSGIAQSTYGDANKWPIIYAANRSRINDPDLIYTGQKIYVPPLTASKPNTTTWIAPVPGPINIRRGGCILDARVGHLHQGVDIGRARNTPVRAVAAGVVRINKAQRNRSGRIVGAGWYILIDHGGFQTVYMHLNGRAYPVVGRRVVRGQIIGRVGDSGSWGAFHLHFQTHVGTNWLAWGRLAWFNKKDNARRGVTVRNPINQLRTHGVFVTSNCPRRETV